MIWDVNPPGDTVQDIIQMPEPNVLVMLVPGLLGLLGLRRWSSLPRS